MELVERTNCTQCLQHIFRRGCVSRGVRLLDLFPKVNDGGLVTGRVLTECDEELGIIRVLLPRVGHRD